MQHLKNLDSFCHRKKKAYSSSGVHSSSEIMSEKHIYPTETPTDPGEPLGLRPTKPNSGSALVSVLRLKRGVQSKQATAQRWPMEYWVSRVPSRVIATYSRC